LNTPISVALDSSRNLYIADSANNRIRKVASSNITTVAGKAGLGYSGDGAAATSALLFSPYGIWLDSQNNLYIADLSNQVVRKVNSSGVITTFAGNNAPGYSGDGGQATSATMTYPFSVVGDSNGNFFIADSNDNRVRKVAPDGTISTYAGNGVGGFSGDNGLATSASIHAPYGLAVDSAGNLFIADSQNNRIRRVGTDGKITTVAGAGGGGFSGDGGPATSAQIGRPFGVAIDAAGSILIADYGNSRIRRVTPDGIINTIAGSAGIGYSGDSGAATSAKLNFPTGVTVDASNGQVYVVDSGNNVIRLLTPSAPAVSGGGVVSASAFGGFSTVAPGSWVEIYGNSLSLSGRSWTTGDFNGNTAPTNLGGTTVTVGGQSAFIDYVSGGQVNAQIPSNVAAGTQTLTVKTQAGTSANYSVTVNSVQPGLLAPGSFKINGTQYVTALFSDNTTYVLPTGAIAGVTSRPAKAGDTITIYGVGFGPVSPTIAAGQIATQSNNLTTPVQFFFNGTQAAAPYSGLSPNYVGLYQFNLVVPNVAAGNVPLTFNLGGTAGTQTLYLAVQ
jgi:uncharacterized protein (TIGR03437 family)